MAAPRKYPDELRERAIRLVLDAKAEPGSGGKKVCRRIGEQLGINPETFRGWVSQAEIDAGSRPGTSTATAALKRDRVTIRSASWPISLETSSCSSVFALVSPRSACASSRPSCFCANVSTV